MTIFYAGLRPVTKGRNSNDSAHPYKGVGTYSNWSIWNTSHVLDGAPNTNHQPGDGYSPHDIAMSRRYRGLDTGSPTDDPGSGARLDNFRTRPFEYKGLDVARAMADPGHVARPGTYTYSGYSNSTFDGLPSAETMVDPGHAVRGIGEDGAAASFGAFAPFSYQGISDSALNDPGRAKPEADAVGVYGHEHVLEWAGVPSAKAL